ncbi:MAG: class I SAM-dependent methyltransferase [Candidatus Scalindua sp.]|nr:class I SAM-dependent methyltransferase [Candidatus Scalindua sp.]
MRKYITNSNQLEEAKKLIIEGVLGYQPFIFSDNLETGVGLEFEKGEYLGLAYYPDIDKELIDKYPRLKRLILDTKYFNYFHKANAVLSRLYDTFIDEICQIMGNIGNITFLDVGCNTGYFPISFALKGAKEAAGCDREPNFSKTVNFLNQILGTNVIFLDTHYDSRTHTIANCKPYDVVTCVTVLMHISDTLFFLNTIGSLATKALFIWTQLNDDAHNSIHYPDEPRGEYKDDKFPLCFDYKIHPSVPLLYKSLELMGFRKFYEIPEKKEIFYAYSLNGCSFYKGILALK